MSKIDVDVIPMINDEDATVLLDASEVPTELPVVTLRGNVLLPGVVLPIQAGRKHTINAVNLGRDNTNTYLAVVSQVDETEMPYIDDLYSIGTVARVLRVVDMPDGVVLCIVQGVARFHLDSLNVDGKYYTGKVTIIEEKDKDKFDKSTNRANKMKLLRKDYTSMMKKAGKSRSPFANLGSITSDKILINFIATHTELSILDKQLLLEEDTYSARLDHLVKMLADIINYYDIQREIHEKAQQNMDKQQREYVLNQQMKAIQDELGGSPADEEAEDLRRRASQKHWSVEMDELFYRELNKLMHAPLQSPDYTVQLNYLNELLALPWNEYTKDNLNVKNAQKVLDRDHYGMEKVKERIIEHIAVMSIKKDLRAPILCLVGPPGTGKTSLGKSIAEALNRKYVRVALGGLHDESEIRGHRRTYIGAMPGRIIKGIKRAGSSNPVFILDEIDKIQSQTHNGDPTAAMLEVLDPEQNSAFHDNYLDVDYDLSKVMFIATANSLSTIQPALIDRMEVIDISGYILEEKIEIAKRHLIPRQLLENGFEKHGLKFSKYVLADIINNYTRESGVRQLDKTLAKVIRRRAVKRATECFLPLEEVNVKSEELQDLLGLPIHNSQKCADKPQVGVVTGLAWTSVGGEILFVECSTSEGKGTISMTGNLGDVMKESATLAFQYIKSNRELLGLSREAVEETNIHIHVPEGATPKDGPSAGITMFVAMISALMGRKVDPSFAMTGEITLRGKVTAVGGIKEKILAAKRAGITHLMLSVENERDIKDIDPQYLSGLTFHYIETMIEALPLVLD